MNINCSPRPFFAVFLSLASLLGLLAGCTAVDMEAAKLYRGASIYRRDLENCEPGRAILADETRNGYWNLRDETWIPHGKALTPVGYPPDLAYDPELEGYFDIYGTARAMHRNSDFHLKLSSDEYFSTISPPVVGEGKRHFPVELLFRERVKMDGEQIHIRSIGRHTLIGSFRFVPWEDEPPPPPEVRAPAFDLTANAGGDEQQPACTLRAVGYREVYYGDDHASEGFLAPLDDGRIMLVFRLDPGLGGDHVGTNAYVASMVYDPDEGSWGGPETVYNSHVYDDRNTHGGVTREGRIVCFFRSFEGLETRRTPGRYVMHSDDQGSTWSEPQTSDIIRGIQGTGQLFFNPDEDRYAIMQYVGRRIEMISSEDGRVWDQAQPVVAAPDVKICEVAGAWCGEQRLVALIRDDERAFGHPLLQVTSSDNGRSWSQLRPTNIPPGDHWGCAPQLVYDARRDLLIALTSDRYSRPDAENRIYIYTARPEDIMEDPRNWTLRFELPRPWAMEDFDGDRPLSESLYGYPTITPINDNEYLVVVTERTRMRGNALTAGGTPGFRINEQADLYSFRLIFE